VAAAIFAVFAAMVIAALAYPPQARLVPLVVGIPAAILAAYQIVREMAMPRPHQPPPDQSDVAGLGRGPLWILLYIAIVLVGGFTWGGPLAVATSQRFWLKEPWKTSIASGIVAFVLIYVVLQEQLGVVLFEGWIDRWVRG
jgi:hypothetical protein